MATQASSLSGALEIYTSRYESALEKNSRREIESFQTNINRINAYYDIVNAASGEGEDDRAQDALDAIVDILEAEGISISTAVVFTTSIAFSTVPSNIEIPTDPDGTDPSYVNAFSDIFITEQNTDQTDKWTLTIQQETNVDASITDNRVSITNITADEGSVVVRCERVNYDTVDLEIPVRKDRQGAPAEGEAGDFVIKLSATDFDIGYSTGIQAQNNRILLDTNVNYGSSTGLRWGLGNSGMYEVSDNQLVISANNISTTGTVNGRDMVADGVKLDSLDNVVSVPGFTDLVWLTGEADDLLPSFYKALIEDQGTVAQLILSQTVGDDQQLALPNDHLTRIVPSDVDFAKGTYEGQIEFEIDDDSANERITAEVYLANSSGTVIDSGIVTEPVGDLGVRPAIVLKSGVLDSTQNKTQYATVIGALAEDITVVTGNRTRIHILVEKIGTAGGNVQFDVYFGSDHQSFFKIPQTISLNDLSDVDVTGATEGNILFFDSDDTWKDTNSVKIETNKFIISPLGSIGDSTGLRFGTGDSGFYESTSNIIKVRVGGTDRWEFQADVFRATDNIGAEFVRVGSGDLNISIRPNAADNSTGLSHPATGVLGLAANGVLVAKVGDGTNPKLLLDPSGTLGTTTGLWFSDNDTGIYELADDVPVWRIGGSDRWRYATTFFESIFSGGLRLSNQPPTDILPVYTFRDDPDTGIGKAGAGILSLITDASESFQVSSNQVTSRHRFYVESDLGGAGEGISLRQQSENPSTSSSYVPIDFRVPTTGLIGQFLATANNYSNASVNLGVNSIALLSEIDNATLLLGAVGTNGEIVFNVSGLGSANEVMRIESDGNVRIGNTSTGVDAILELNSTTGAILLPRLTTTEVNALSPANGMIVYNTDENNFQGRVGGVWLSFSGDTWQHNGTSIYYNVGNVGIGTTTPQTLLSLDGGVGTIATGLSFGGDTGFYEVSDNSLRIDIGGSVRWQITNSVMGAVGGNSPVFVNETASATNPVIVPRSSDTNTGIGGGDGLDELSLITGAVEAIRITSSQQVGIGVVPATSALLELSSTTGALIHVRMSTTERDALTAVNGMEIYNSTDDKFQLYQAGLWVDSISSGNPSSGSLGAVQMSNGSGEFFDSDDIIANSSFNWSGKRLEIFDNTTNKNVLINTNPNLTGSSNYVIGENSGLGMTTASNNVLLGKEAGRDLVDRNSNVYIGHQAGLQNTQDENIMIGDRAGQQAINGDSNVLIGHVAAGFGGEVGRTVSIGYVTASGGTGSILDSVFIGYRAGSGVAGDISNKLFIANNTGDPLIYGEFDNEIVKVNGLFQTRDGAVIPLPAKDETASSYTLDDDDDSFGVIIDDAFTIPTGLTVGKNYLVFNDSLSPVSITTTGLTVKGNDSLTDISAEGVITIWVYATNSVVIKGDLE